MSNTDIHLANGDISAYGLACGYVQVSRGGPIIPDRTRRAIEDHANHGRGIAPSDATIPRYEVRMTFNGCTYDVKRWDHEDLNRDTTAWEQYETVREARAAFRAMTRSIGKH